MIEIPLKRGSENAHQTFSMRLGNNFLDFEINYISYLEDPAWSMDIRRDGSPLALGVMLEPGANLIQNYRANIGNLVFVGLDATIDNLGVDNHLIWTPA